VLIIPSSWGSQLGGYLPTSAAQARRRVGGRTSTVQSVRGVGGPAIDVSCSADARSGSSLAGGCLKAAPFCVHLLDLWVDDRAGAKSLCAADDGDACGRRHLLEGVVMALLRVPLRTPGETLDPIFGSGSGGAAVSFPPVRRCLGCSWYPRCISWSRWWPPSDLELLGRNVHR
jgi:hypothetical protein